MRLITIITSLLILAVSFPLHADSVYVANGQVSTHEVQILDDDAAYHVVVTIDYGKVTKEDVEIIKEKMQTFTCEARVKIDVSYDYTDALVGCAH